VSTKVAERRGEIDDGADVHGGLPEPLGDLGIGRPVCSVEPAHLVALELATAVDLVVTRDHDIVEVE